MKILMIVNDALLADFLLRLLQKNGYETKWVWDSEEGVDLAETNQFDLLVLDAQPSVGNGCEVLQKVRSRHCGIPVLMLTDVEGTEEEVAYLEAGADCCMTKLFDSKRLLAYVHVLLRRQGGQRDVLVVGDILLDLSNCLLSCGGRTVRLSAKEFDVLRFLMSAKEQILSKKQILCRVWGYDTDAVENHVEVYVGKLRKKLKQVGSGVQIKAIRCLGYVMEME